MVCGSTSVPITCALPSLMEACFLTPICWLLHSAPWWLPAYKIHSACGISWSKVLKENLAVLWCIISYTETAALWEVRTSCLGRSDRKSSLFTAFAGALSRLCLLGVWTGRRHFKLSMSEDSACFHHFNRYEYQVKYCTWNLCVCEAGDCTCLPRALLLHCTPTTPNPWLALFKCKGCSQKIFRAISWTLVVNQIDMPHLTRDTITSVKSLGHYNICQAHGTLWHLSRA